MAFWCSLALHNWGKWEDGTTEKYVHSGPTSPTRKVAIQIRYCNRCNLRDTRKVKL